MSQEPFDLKPFARRVRLLQAWKGLAWGLLAGAGISLAWLALDWMERAYAEVPWMLAILGVGAVGGALAGWFRKVSDESLALSIDMRARLADRLSTAWELRSSAAPMDEAQREDAAQRVEALKPQALFPWKFTRWHSAALAASVLPVAALYLLTSSLLASPAAKAKAEKGADQAAQLERVAKPIEEAAKKPSDPLSPDKRELAREMQKLARDLRRSRLNDEEAMQRANALNDQAKKLSDKQIEQAKSQLAPLKASAVEAALQKAAEKTPSLSPSELKESALKDAERSLLKDLMKSAKTDESRTDMEGQEGMDSALSPDKLKALEEQGIDPELAEMTSKERSELQKEISRQMKELAEKGSLSEADKEKMELLKELADKLRLTEEARKTLDELMNSQEYKDLQQAAEELAKQMEQAQQQAAEEDRPLTQEEMEQIRRAAEEYQEAMKQFVEDMKDPAKKEEVLQAMREMMEQLKNGELSLEACRTCLGLLPLPMKGGGLPVPSASKEGGSFQDTDQINKLDKPDPGKGKGIATRVRGTRDPKRGSESYIEVKAPTFSGTRSSVPYSQVLPQYRRQAERAIDRQQVPKADEAKVRRYFDSLTGARP